MKKGDNREAEREAGRRAALIKKREAGRNNFAAGRFRFKFCLEQAGRRKK